MIKRIQILFIFLLVGVSLRFFDARFINESFRNYFVFLYILSAIVLSIPYVFPKGVGFIFPIQLIILTMLISIFMAKMSWGQSLSDSIIVTVPMMLWLFFFYLLRIKIPIRTIERIILIYGIIYIILYFYQLTHSKTVYFGGGDEFREERGTVRFILAGDGIFFLSSFIALTKLTTQKRGKWLWISISIFGILIPFFIASRQLICGISLIYLFHFIKNQPLYKKGIILIIFFIMVFYLINSDNAILKGILEAQEITAREGKDYIRILSGTYFLTDFAPDNVSKVLGNGVPYVGISDYGKFVENLKLEGFYMTDVGIIAFYAMFGILGIISYILIWIKSFTLSLPNENYYTKYYLWFLLFTSLTSANVYYYSSLIATVFTLYIYQTVYIDKIRLDSDFAD